MKKLNNKFGMTMAEMLIVVAIIVVLAGVAFIAVNNHQRSLGQLERDGIAKEIFVAAQNHLTMAYGEGYLGTTDFGTPGTATEDTGKRIFYYVVNGSVVENSILDQMLPFGSIDETVRAGGSYIIRYQKDTGTVLDVFYCTRSGSPTRFNVSSLGSGDYALAMNARESKDDRRTGAWRNTINGPILGYYGGTDAADIPTIVLKPPTIKVFNEEKLYVEVTDPNTEVKDQKGNTVAQLKLIITGVDSKAQKAYELKPIPADTNHVKYYSPSTLYTVILDDITTSGMHFGEINADTTEKFIPGEDITIQAVAYSNSAFSNIAYSSRIVNNSLFGSINSTKDTAYIGNIRHLENLDKVISSLDIINGKTVNENIIVIKKAEQTDSFSWITFQKAVKKIETKSTTGTPSETGYASVGVYDFGGAYSGNGYYKPIVPNYEFIYDGKSHSISDVAVNVTGDAGLFGSISTVTAISNLELIDFSVTGTTSAGALAGSLTGCTVTNVLARNSAASSTAKITATTIAGGLIGKLTGGTVQYSAAAVIVDGGTTAYAGGLVGTVSGNVNNCYSGGHTSEGSYDKWIGVHGYDVKGSAAGGLIGNIDSSAVINNSYSTCSVSGGTAAGGFAGIANGAVNNSYCTGRVEPDYPNPTDKSVRYENAFCSGGLHGGGSGNSYYSIINEVLDHNGTFVYKAPGTGAIAQLDANVTSYNSFVGAMGTWDSAKSYDTSLISYYGGKYPLRTVLQLPPTSTKTLSPNTYFVSTHYGDWPAPEIFIINSK